MMMAVNVLIIGMLLVIVYTLGSGLYYLLKDPAGKRRTVKALTWRMGLSVTLFCVLLICFSTGILTPHLFTPL